MSNATAHKIGAGLVVGGLYAGREYRENGQVTEKSLASAGLASLLGSLPDLLEPATHPNHRRFLHSYCFAGGLCIALYKAYKWEPKDDTDKFLRWLALIAGGAYMTHLLMDARTPKGLPLI